MKNIHSSYFSSHISAFTSIVTMFFPILNAQQFSGFCNISPAIAQSITKTTTTRSDTRPMNSRLRMDRGNSKGEQGQYSGWRKYDQQQQQNSDGGVEGSVTYQKEFTEKGCTMIQLYTTQYHPLTRPRFL